MQLRGLGTGINDGEGQAEFGCQVPEEIGRVFLRGDITLWNTILYESRNRIAC